jgi:hypothetical protein
MQSLIKPHKAALIDWAIAQYEVKSLVDLGACWGVHGEYTFGALRKHQLDKAVIVDGSITAPTEEMAGQFSQVELIEGPLGDEVVANRVGKVDAAIMFDILLHQVSPDWDQFLTLYAENIDTLIIYNQNWLGKDTVRFIDFGLEGYLRRVPNTNEARTREWFAQHDEFRHEQDRLWRDVHNFWQWGITEKDLVGELWDLGYKIDRLANYGKHSSDYPEVEEVGLICHKRNQSVSHRRVLQPDPVAASDPSNSVARIADLEYVNRQLEVEARQCEAAYLQLRNRLPVRLMFAVVGGLRQASRLATRLRSRSR